MKIIVQKFGGTSLTTPEIRTRVGDIIAAARENGYGVVVVVSAMGRFGNPYATDTLINLVKEANPHPDLRELDIIMTLGEIISGVIISSELKARGVPATYISSAEAGIITDNNHGEAHIVCVKPIKILELLEAGQVVVVPGFQGISESNEITSLGRGGSDTTASALGVALNAEYIDIFTDVEGIMTADPNIVDNARVLNAVTYYEVCQLARDGAKVVHPRAVEIAMQKGIPLRVRSTVLNSTGTLISNQEKISMENSLHINERIITGITYTTGLAQIKIIISPGANKQDIELKVFKSLADYGISVDFISIHSEAIIFTVPNGFGNQVRDIMNKQNIAVEIVPNCAKVAVVGAAITGIPGVMSKVIETLSEEKIKILQSGDSYTNIWCLVAGDKMESAVKSLHDKFGLGNTNK